MIDAAMVWRAYQALHRYCAAPEGTLRVGATWTGPTEGPPAALAVDPKGPKFHASVGELAHAAQRDKAAADAIAMQVRLASHSEPLNVDDEYFTYLYLFAQLLRVSRSKLPHFVSPEVGWRSLVWRPLFVLAGKDGSAQAKWRNFYYQYWQAADPKPTEEDLRRRFPWPPKRVELLANVIENQLEMLLETMETLQVGADHVFKWCDRIGQPLNGAPPNPDRKWLPLLIAARPESYWPQPSTGKSVAAASSRVRALIADLVGSKKQFTTFIEKTVPFCNPEREGAALASAVRDVLTGIDDVVEHINDRDVTKAWTRRRVQMEAEEGLR